MGAERSHPSSDFLAKFTMTNRGRASDRRGPDRSLYLGGLIQLIRFSPAFSFRRLSGDGLSKRHGLCD